LTMEPIRTTQSSPAGVSAEHAATEQRTAAAVRAEPIVFVDTVFLLLCGVPVPGAAGTGRGWCGLGAAATCGAAVPVCSAQRPVNGGGRRSRNARAASPQSAEVDVVTWRSASRSSAESKSLVSAWLDRK